MLVCKYIGLSMKEFSWSSHFTLSLFKCFVLTIIFQFLDVLNKASPVSHALSMWFTAQK